MTTASLQTNFGSLGVESFNRMNTQLRKINCTSVFNETSRTFTIIGSSGIEKGRIENIFAEVPFDVWWPHCLDTKDQGNWVVEFRDKPPVKNKLVHHSFDNANVVVTPEGKTMHFVSYSKNGDTFVVPFPFLPK